MLGEIGLHLFEGVDAVLADGLYGSLAEPGGPSFALDLVEDGDPPDFQSPPLGNTKGGGAFFP